MATVNKRVKNPQVQTINGIDAGGAMQIRIQAGFDNKAKSAPDGLAVSLQDKSVQYVRGSIVTQDWIHAV